MAVRKGALIRGSLCPRLACRGRIMSPSSSHLRVQLLTHNPLTHAVSGESPHAALVLSPSRPLTSSVTDTLCSTLSCDKAISHVV
ncbi:hypothetical protein E2C01_067975 [Portunus trituberculatus]|uniref:Uncharacterized protein n=1 Tax=Portunus trituberculatus TaxID=210409 RepID=A0A5B7HV56_PORTR|nr:hypothetical protein [Portunus trituberculatus]